MSGSGKSSLAFDTIYAEGQRRYVESLSAYARQFLGQLDKPKYESLRGPAPTIAIEQKDRVIESPLDGGNRYRDLRLPAGAVGAGWYPALSAVWQARRTDVGSEMANQLRRLPMGSQLTLLAPVAEGRKGSPTAKRSKKPKTRLQPRTHRRKNRPHRDLPPLSKKHKHTIHIVTDRITLSDDAETDRRLADSLEGTLKAR